MLLIIENVLSKEEVQQFRAHMEQANWEPGSKSAGTLARSAKQNLQLDDASELATSLRNHISGNSNHQTKCSGIKRNLNAAGQHHGITVALHLNRHEYFDHAKDSTQQPQERRNISNHA